MRKRWWLCYATDFQTLMFPCFICSRILGIFPYKLNASTFEISKLYCILSTVIICVCCVINFVLVYNVVKSNINFGSVIWNIHAVIFYTLTSFIVIITHFQSVPRKRLLQTILKTSSELLPSKSYQKLSRLFHVKDILCNIFRIMQFSMHLSKLLKFDDTFITIFTWMITMYFSLLVLQIVMFYVNCVCVLKACFKRLNDNLVHMQKFVINNTNLRVSNTIKHIQKKQCLLTKLRILKKQHLKISDTVQLLNTIFSMQLLTTIVLASLVVIIELYFYAVRWQNGVFFRVDLRFLDMFLTSMIYNIFIIILIVWACETGKNQAQKIRTTIHDLLNNTNDEKIKYELQLFSLQILHRKNIFSLKGLTIDATLLAAVSKQSFVINITIFIIQRFCFAFR
ncbi:Putative gustatory receptor 28b [Cyphomyrmex costatus]|uniref:Gustatory receptor n=1 Tax=Cyphomyrmex costatus TaxID=456900 RepID=A0A195CSS8_9HYME|nr:Putative gustatory receptor 28b [Cyphomyrmex costatus]